MKIVFEEIAPSPTTTGTVYHYGTVTHKGKDYDFTIAEMYEDNSDSTEFDVTVLDCEDDIDTDEIIQQLQEEK